MLTSKLILSQINSDVLLQVLLVMDKMTQETFILKVSCVCYSVCVCFLCILVVLSASLVCICDRYN